MPYIVGCRGVNKSKGSCTGLVRVGPPKIFFYFWTNLGPLLIELWRVDFCHFEKSSTFDERRCWANTSISPIKCVSFSQCNLWTRNTRKKWNKSYKWSEKSRKCVFKTIKFYIRTYIAHNTTDNNIIEPTDEGMIKRPNLFSIRMCRPLGLFNIQHIIFLQCITR